MASEKKGTGEVLKDQNVFVRILNLRFVNAALESIENLYISTKQAHPILSSVCGLYEKGVSRAGSLTLWSMQPALHVLEPQLIAANSMACRGLDRLEEKVPALRSPPAELAENIKEVISSTLETAKNGIACPIKHTSNVVLGKVSTGYQQSKNGISDGIQYVLNSKLVYLAEQRAIRALSVTENSIEHVLPVSSAETEDDGSMGELEPDVGSSGPKPSFSRLRALAGTICTHAFEKTAAQLQRSKRQGQELVTRIPGVSLLSNGLPTFLSGLGKHLLKVCESVVLNVTKTPQTSIGLAKDGVNIVLGSFVTVMEKALHNLSYYRLQIPRRSSKPKGGSQLAWKDRAEERLRVTEPGAGDHMHRPSDNSENQYLNTTGPKEISEETRQLKKKVMKQISMQQKVVLEGSKKKFSNHGSSR